MPLNVTFIEEGVFEDCTRLTNIYINQMESTFQKRWCGQKKKVVFYTDLL